MIEQKRELDHSPQQDVFVSPMGQGDEISLRDIWQILNSQRNLIFLFIFVATLVSLAAAILLPKVYRSRVVLLPPLASNVEHLNIPDFYDIKTAELYGKFLRNLQSANLQENFFRAHNLLEVLQSENQANKNEHEVFLKFFSDQLLLKRLSTVTKDKNVYSISLDGDDPEQIAGWLNDYVAYIDMHTVQSIVNDIETKVKVRMTLLEKKVKSLREVAMLRRLDKVALIEEAANIASKLQIDEQVGSVYTYRQEVKGKHEELTITKETPSYLRGRRALLTEIEALKNRKSDDPFIPTLRNLQEELFFIKTISPDVKEVHATRIDQQAIAVYTPVKPKRKLIVIFGSIFGAVVGLSIAFIRGIIGESSSNIIAQSK